MYECYLNILLIVRREHIFLWQCTWFTMIAITCMVHCGKSRFHILLVLLCFPHQQYNPFSLPILCHSYRSVSRDFKTWVFFHDLNLTGPRDKQAKIFSNSISSASRHSITKVSPLCALCNTLCKWSPQCATHLRDNLRCVQHTGETISTVCNIQRRLSLRCATHRGDDLSVLQHNLHGAQHTAKIISAVRNTPQHTAETISAVWNIPRR